MSTKAAVTKKSAAPPTATQDPATKMAVVRKGRAPVDPNETKEQKLSRLANKRVTLACKYIRLVGNLATYKPSAKQIEKIMLALGESCAAVQNRFEGTRKESVTFRLIE